MLLVMIDDRVLEVDGPPLAVGEAAVLEYLEENVRDVRVRLLDLVEQHHRVGPGGAPLRSAGRPLRIRRTPVASR